jgi:hypothetical protein
VKFYIAFEIVYKVICKHEQYIKEVGNTKRPIVNNYMERDVRAQETQGKNIQEDSF